MPSTDLSKKNRCVTLRTRKDSRHRIHDYIGAENGRMKMRKNVFFIFNVIDNIDFCNVFL